MDDCSKVIELEPNLAYIYFNRGRANGNLGNFKAAIDDFSWEIEDNPYNTVAIENKEKAEYFYKKRSEN